MSDDREKSKELVKVHRIHLNHIARPPFSATTGTESSHSLVGAAATLCFCIPSLRDSFLAEKSNEPVFRTTRAIFTGFGTERVAQTITTLGHLLTSDEGLATPLDIVSKLIAEAQTDYTERKMYFEQARNIVKEMLYSEAYQCPCGYRMKQHYRSDFVLRVTISGPKSLHEAISKSFTGEVPPCPSCKKMCEATDKCFPEYLLVSLEHSGKNKLPLNMCIDPVEGIHYGIVAFLRKHGGEYTAIIKAENDILEYKAGLVRSRDPPYFFKMMRGMNSGEEAPEMVLLQRMREAPELTGHVDYAPLDASVTAELFNYPIPRYTNRTEVCGLISAITAVLSLPLVLQEDILKTIKGTPKENEEVLAWRILTEGRADALGQVHSGFQFATELNRNILVNAFLTGLTKKDTASARTAGSKVADVLTAIFSGKDEFCRFVANASFEDILLYPAPGLHCFVLQQMSKNIDRLLMTWSKGDVLMLFLYQDSDQPHSTLLIRRNEEEVILIDNHNVSKYNLPYLQSSDWVQAVLHFVEEEDEAEANNILPNYVRFGNPRAVPVVRAVAGPPCPLAAMADDFLLALPGHSEDSQMTVEFPYTKSIAALEGTLHVIEKDGYAYIRSTATKNALKLELKGDHYICCRRYMKKCSASASLLKPITDKEAVLSYIRTQRNECVFRGELLEGEEGFVPKRDCATPKASREVDKLDGPLMRSRTRKGTGYQKEAQ